MLAPRVVGPSELDQLLQEVLSQDTLDIPGKLQQIAFSSKDGQSRLLILHHIGRALAERDENWCPVFRCMTLVETLLRRGSLEIVNNITLDYLWQIQKWRTHQVIENREEVAGRIREKAEIITELCLGSTKLNRERDQDYNTYASLIGITRVPRGNWVHHSGLWMGQHHTGQCRQTTDVWHGSDRRMGPRPTEAFCNITGASPSVAEDVLEPHRGDLLSALKDYQKPTQATRDEVFFGGPFQSGIHQEAGWIEAARRCEYVQAKLRCTEPRARMWLERSYWDVDWAISLGQAECSFDGSVPSGSGFGHHLVFPDPAASGKGGDGLADFSGGFDRNGAGFRGKGGYSNTVSDMYAFSNVPTAWGHSGFASEFGCQPSSYGGFQQAGLTGLQLPGGQGKGCQGIGGQADGLNEVFAGIHAFGLQRF